MAFRSNGPTTLMLPPFRGATRQLILTAMAVFVAVVLLASFGGLPGARLTAALPLTPVLLFHGYLWQLVTYPFVPNGMGLVSIAFALISLWFFGSALEDERGSRWLLEFFVASTVGGGLLASLLAWASQGRAFGLNGLQSTDGLYPFLMALLLAYARSNADQDIMFMFFIRMKARHLAAIYLLFYLGLTLVGGDRFGALTALCNALAGWMYLRFVPRRGLGFAAAEQVYGLRNAWYRSKRKRAAKKFTVYMRKQGKDAPFDESGRYMGDQPRDPNDKRWMN